ncbi:MAG: PDZ domain-containing protein [Cyanobacteriota bacterium]|nr:PDZ domain-containing protein [Cyanobacteriota bacterium]
MNLSSNLTKLALAFPATLLVASVATAYPCNRAKSVNVVETSSQRIRIEQVDSPSGTIFRVIPASFSSDPQATGFIGVAIEQLTPERAEDLNRQRTFGRSIPETEGVLVLRTLSDGPAELAGLQAGDVLLGVNGEMVTSVQQVQQLIGGSQVGQMVPVTYQRGRAVDTTVVSVGDAQVLRGRMLRE